MKSSYYLDKKTILNEKQTFTNWPAKNSKSKLFLMIRDLWEKQTFKCNLFQINLEISWSYMMTNIFLFPAGLTISALWRINVLTLSSAATVNTYRQKMRWLENINDHMILWFGQQDKVIGNRSGLLIWHINEPISLKENDVIWHNVTFATHFSYINSCILFVGRFFVIGMRSSRLTWV